MSGLASIHKAFLAGTASLVLISCAATPTVTQAQQGSDIPVIVMLEDSDPNSVIRTSDIARRVTSEIQEQMSRYDFYVMDEEFLTVRMGWQVRARRPKTELMQVVVLANQAGDPRLAPRAMVLYKIRAAAQNVGFATKAMVRIMGETYDNNGRFISSWEAPRMEFPAPANCAGVCIQEVVGDHAREVGAQVADVLRKKLAYLTRGAGAPVAGGTAAAAPAATAPAADSGYGLATIYRITFKNFTTRELLEITEVMETEFPQYVSSEVPSGDTTKWTYGYRTKAPAQKIHKWLNILLMDMGLDPDSQVKITMAGTDIQLDKIFGSSPVGPGPSPRFQ